jgi:hypothetical protein
MFFNMLLSKISSNLHSTSDRTYVRTLCKNRQGDITSKVVSLFLKAYYGSLVSQFNIEFELIEHSPEGYRFFHKVNHWQTASKFYNHIIRLWITIFQKLSHELYRCFQSQMTLKKNIRQNLKRNHFSKSNLGFRKLLSSSDSNSNCAQEINLMDYRNHNRFVAMSFDNDNLR